MARISSCGILLYTPLQHSFFEVVFFMNKVFLRGNLGADPDVRYTAGEGTAVATLRLATNERFKKDGETKIHTEWHRVVLFGKQAELARDYLKKGASLIVIGKIRYRKWQDKSGEDRYITEILGDEIEFIDRKQSNAQAGNQQPARDPGFDDNFDDFPSF